MSGHQQGHRRSKQRTGKKIFIFLPSPQRLPHDSGLIIDFSIVPKTKDVPAASWNLVSMEMSPKRGKEEGEGDPELTPKCEMGVN